MNGRVELSVYTNQQHDKKKYIYAFDREAEE